MSQSMCVVQDGGPVPDGVVPADGRATVRPLVAALESDPAECYGRAWDLRAFRHQLGCAERTGRRFHFGVSYGAGPAGRSGRRPGGRWYVDPMADFRITCPGCSRPLAVPPAAVGQPSHCPHCRTDFRLPANPDGSPGAPVPTAGRVRVPRPVAGPGFALLASGLVGVVVNGSFAVLFAVKPGADLEYARERVRELRGLDTALHGKPPDADAADRAAREEALARAMAPSVAPSHRLFAAVSGLAAAGGVAMLVGRAYPLAVVGCLAGIGNVHHFCCVPGGLAGAWGLLVLVRDDGRAIFRRPADSGGGAPTPPVP